MPAFPFAQMPTFGEFLRVAEREFGCVYQVVNEFQLAGPDGVYFSVLQREVNGRLLEVKAPRLSNEDRLTLTTLRNLCNRLRIPQERFDLDFDP